jgi:hypothetical protein
MLLNEPVARVGGGSWAHAGRGTYLAELERLEVDTVRLLLGTMWQTDRREPAIGPDSARLLGQAFAESRQEDLAGFRLLLAAADRRLDPYNRWQALRLLTQQIAYSSEPEVRQTLQAQLGALRLDEPELEALRERLLGRFEPARRF